MVMKTVKAMIAEAFSQRKSGNELFVVGMLMLATDDQVGNAEPGTTQQQQKTGVFPCYAYASQCAANVIDKLKQLETRQRVIITKMLEYPHIFRLTCESKVISNVSAFRINEELVESFIRPEVVTVAEANGSPNKRRMSVCGDVVEVGECSKSSDFKRRCLMMEGEGASVEVVLWGEAAVENVTCGKAVITAGFKDGKRLVSTGSSKIETSPNSTTEESGVVIGLGDMESGFPIEVVLETDESLLLDEGVKFDYDVELPIHIKFRRSGRHIESISIDYQ